jgi:hypothetical protein
MQMPKNSQGCTTPYKARCLERLAKMMRTKIVWKNRWSESNTKQICNAQNQTVIHSYIWSFASQPTGIPICGIDYKEKHIMLFSHHLYLVPILLHGMSEILILSPKKPCMCRSILRQNPIQRIQHSWRLIIPKATAPTLKELILKTCLLMQACQWDDSSSKKFMSHLEIRLRQDIVLLGISLPFGSSSLP